jgi:predicted amidohydrolase YtcJ
MSYLSMLFCSRTSSTVLLLLLLVRTSYAEPPADLVLTGGNVITVDAEIPKAEAVACRGDRIVAVGSAEDIGILIGPGTKVIPLKGRTVVPGFIEGHGHFIGLGRSKMILDLTVAKSWQDIVELVREAAAEAEPGAWIIGRGWHQSKWNAPPEPNVEGYPIHTGLSRVSPRNPVELTHASGHMSFVNELAMRMSGITAETADPAGGKILRDKQGRPTGALRETAQSLVASNRQSQLAQAEQDRRAIALATQECLRKGITSFQDAGASFRQIDLFRELADAGKLRLRLWLMVRESNGRLQQSLAKYRTIGAGNQHLTVRAIKSMIDGALGSQGAWLLEPYNDLPDSKGLQLISLDYLARTAELAREHDYQLCVHAIGDRANRETLNVFERAFGTLPRPNDLRWRIEHAQHLHPDDIPRFAQLGVIASMQAVHATSDAPFVIERLGQKRAQDGAYAWKSLLDTGAVIVNGTDAPVEDVDPLASFYAAVTRKLPDGSTFFPEQTMTRRQALRSYTIDAAYAAFEEDLKGSLTPGKLADMVVLSRDLLTCPEKEILSTQVELTIIGGKIEFARNPGTDLQSEDTVSRP